MEENALKEYEICLTSIHHHETTMWTLLSLHLGITGVLLKFWMDAGAFNKNNHGYLIMTISLFTGIFVFFALIKHRLFWNLEMKRATELEENLGIKRYTYFEDLFIKNCYIWKNRRKHKVNKSKIGRLPFSIWSGFSAWEISVVIVFLTIFGSWFIIYKALKELTTLDLILFQIDGNTFLGLTILCIILYTVYAKILNHYNTKKP